MSRLGVVLVALLSISAAALAGTEHVSRPRVITLEQAYNIALATDQSIRIAYWEIRKANLLPWSALTKLGPQLTAGADFGKSATNTTAPTTVVSDVTSISSTGAPVTSTEFQTFDSQAGFGSGTISFQQPLIDLTVFPAYRYGKLSIEAARLQHRFTIRETLFGVVTAYYEVIKQQELVAVNREALILSNGQLELAQARLRAQEVTRTDVLRAQVTVETARQTLVASENTLELDLNTLANILNLQPDTLYQVVEPPQYPTALPSFTDLLQRAYGHREDLRVKVIAIDQEIQLKNEVLGQYGPRVVLEASGQVENNTGTSRSRTASWSADLSVQIPILTGGQREIDFLTAQRQLEETKLQRDQAAKTVESDVKTAWLAVHTLEETLKASRVQVAAADQAYKDLQNQYAAGTATSVDVLSGLNDLNTARKNLAQQTCDYQVALRDLEEVSGVFQDSRVQKAKIR